MTRDHAQADILRKDNVDSRISGFEAFQCRGGRSGESQRHSVPGEGETLEGAGAKKGEENIAAGNTGISDALRKAGREKRQEEKEEHDSPVDCGNAQLRCQDFPHRGRILPRGLERFNEVGYDGLDLMIRSTCPPTMRSIRPLRAVILILSVCLSACLAPAREPAETVEKAPAAGEELPFESMSTAIALGRPEEALESYEHARAAKPQSPATRILHARLLMISGRLEDARSELELVLAVEPGNTDALYNLSVLDGLAGRLKEQETLLRKVVAIDDGHPDALAALGEQALENGEDAEAGGLFERALAREPSHLAALLGKGAVFSRAKDWKSAEALYDKAVHVQPDYPFAYIDRARARQALDDAPGALQDLSRAIEIAPDYPWSYIDRAKLYLRRAQRPEAIADLSTAITLEPGQFEAYALRAGALSNGGDADRAIADWERVVSLKPGYWYAYAPLAVLYWTRGEWAKARTALLRAYEFQEEEYSLALCAALCWIRQGNRREAAGILQQVLDRVPGESWQRDVARFLLDTNSGTALLARIDRERNSALKARMLFYVAIAWLNGGMERAGRTYLVQIAGRGLPQAIETRLADVELQRSGLASPRESQ